MKRTMTVVARKVSGMLVPRMMARVCLEEGQSAFLHLASLLEKGVWSTPEGVELTRPAPHGIYKGTK